MKVLHFRKPLLEFFDIFLPILGKSNQNIFDVIPDFRKIT